uniref:Phospholipid-transporting ATPase n=1 Tax=Syphacia muris TaxID=451379 RepID=A0A0N5AVX2_9BILA
MRLKANESNLSPTRAIYIGKRKHNLTVSNAISTCKYNIWTFIPKFLKEQFRQYNNLYFLLIVLLQQIPEVSPTGRYNTAVPFALVLLASAVKEIYEDIKRKKSDVRANDTITTVFRRSGWRQIKWKDVSIGDILKIYEGEIFPADLLMISSSNSDNTCLVETSNLDGETNLKVRDKFNCQKEMCTPEQLSQLDCKIVCEQPIKTIDKFSGFMDINAKPYPLVDNHSISKAFVSVSENLLLRGTRLKETEFVIGIAVYTGHETKLFLNFKKCPLKQSTISSVMNGRLIYLFIALIFLTLCSTLGSLCFEHFALANAYYLDYTRNSLRSFVTNVGSRFITFLLLYNNFIPISLQFTMDIVRFGQAQYINMDKAIYDKSENDMPIARTSNLTEELGQAIYCELIQVEYVMCDKTGTLTQNKMEFKYCSIAGKSYSVNSDTSAKIFDIPDDKEVVYIFTKYFGKLCAQLDNYEKEFFRNVTICNKVRPHTNKLGEITYNSLRPDEDALVRGAASVNFKLLNRNSEIVSVSELGEEKQYHILNTFDFTSERKRMSIIVRCPDGSIRVYVKGADSVILPRIINDCTFKAQLLQDYDGYGLRTLFFASRKLDEQLYNSWNLMYQKASDSCTNREQMLCECVELIETKLNLVGISAVEDKLQVGVKETVRCFIDAGIRVWMLTGDNPKTAIAVGYAANLCSKNDQKLILLNRSCDESVGEFRRIAKLIDGKSNRFMVIDGISLRNMLGEGGREPFLFLVRNCRTVICCRLSPMDKAKVVELIRKDNSVVMAVGDGANDVAMIRAANVGAGIIGKEGSEAAAASDYAIRQFRFLQRLIFLHGVWNLKRSMKVILYSFYKNICLYLIQFWYASSSAYSGQTLFDRWTIALFNSIFTFFPPIAIGLFEKPISAKGCMDKPEVYNTVRATAYSKRYFGWLMLDAVLDSLLIYHFSHLILPDLAACKCGRTGGLLMLGNTCYSLVMVTVCLKAIFMCTTRSYLIFTSSIVSVLLWVLLFYLYSQRTTKFRHGTPLVLAQRCVARLP